MASLNKTLLIGNLTRDPELRYTPSGTAVCDFSIAVNRKWKGSDGQMKEDVAFIECTAWARTAEVVNQYTKKGQSIFVEGHIQQDRWEDKETGQKRSKLKITVERVQFLGKKETEAASDAAPAAVQDDSDIPF